MIVPLPDMIIPKGMASEILAGRGVRAGRYEMGTPARGIGSGVASEAD